MILQDRQARVIAGLAERAVDHQVAIDTADKRNLYPTVEVAIQVGEGEHGRDSNGWKRYLVETTGRSTASG